MTLALPTATTAQQEELSTIFKGGHIFKLCRIYINGSNSHVTPQH